MSDRNLDVTAYLDRIGYAGEIAATGEVLRHLMRAHLLSVPFENLDIVRRVPISLETGALQDKIVVRRRGGFCYELNGLFALLLEQLGFLVTRLSASDALDDGTCGPEFDHLTLLVRCADDEVDSPGWLTDVGWGDSFREPLRLAPSLEQAQDGRLFWLEPRAESLLLWMREANGNQERQYIFTQQPRHMADFLPMCVYHQTSPQSGFTRHRVCTRALPDGRVTLRDHRLIVTRNGVRDVREFDEAEFTTLLHEHFDMEWPTL